MAKGFLAYVDAKLEELFNRKPHDPTRDRQRALAHLDMCEEQYRNPPAKGRKFVTTRGDTTKFAPRYKFYSRSEHYMPRERFPDAIKSLRSEIQAGQHDSVIGAQPGKSSAKGWTPARRAAYQATMAAKKGK